jgi:hypothetical protein
MSARELFEWMLFEREFGPLTVQERVDYAGAISAWGSLRAMGAKPTPDKLLPQWASEDAPEEFRQSADEMIGVMRAMQKKGTRDDES